MIEQNSHRFMSKELAEELTSRYGSPLYVYDSETIVDNVKNLKQSAKNVHVSYAMKANSNSEILKILQNSGIKAVDVVSPGEIYRALQNSYDPNDILYTQNFISEEQIDYALKKEVRLNIGAVQTLRNFSSKLKGKQIFIRLNPDLGAGENYNVITGGPNSKFGIYSTDLDDVLQITKENDIKIVGLHQHIGSNLKGKDKEIFLKATQTIFQTAAKFPDVKYINIGGGLGIQYKKEEQLLNLQLLYQKIEQVRKKYSEKWERHLEVWIEPGRFLVGNSGVLLCRITAKKSTPQRIFYGTDTGFNHLLRPALYDSYHHITNLSNPNATKETVTVCGNICQSTDNLANKIELGGEAGDILCIENAGAYGFCMSSNYNERCKPAQVLLEGKNHRVIRRRQTFEDLIEKN